MTPPPLSFSSPRMAMDAKLLPVLIVAGVVLWPVLAQNYSCNPGVCCDKYGICSLQRCGEGCQSGPCNSTPVPGYGGCVSVANIVTEGFFDQMLSKLDVSCPRKNFYTRCDFLDALNLYPEFGQGSYAEDSKREVAAFFTHASHSTQGFCYIEEIGGQSKNYCSKNYPCVGGKQYYGRGPLQLQWNYNYGPAGEKIGFDGLNNPEIVANDPLISFKTAFWIWMGVHQIVNKGFSATIHYINGAECNGGNPAAVASRVKYYEDYCNQLGVYPGDNLSC